MGCKLETPTFGQSLSLPRSEASSMECKAARDHTCAAFRKFTLERAFTHHGLRFKNPSPLRFCGSRSYQCSGSCFQYKKSSSGLCHPPQGSWYERIKKYQPYDSVDACLDSGGKLPDGVSLASVQQVQEQKGKLQSYERSAFGQGWEDADGDCQDSRTEALIAQSTTKVRLADERRCRVVSGR